MSNNKKYNYIDLFAGAGGLSEGFIMQGDFEALAHVELNKDACETLKTRLCYHYLKRNNNNDTYLKYLKSEISKEDLHKSIPKSLLDSVINAEISDESLNEIFKIIDEIIAQKKIQNLDLIVGGPPCQAYSLMGRSVSKTKMKNDPRNYLYKQYVKFLKRYQPKMFIFENVPGILNANGGKTIQEIQAAFKEAGYHSEYRIQNAHDFGVLQNRKRVIIIGWKNTYKMKYPEFTKSIPKNVYVSHILDDLSPVKRDSSNNKYLSKPNEYLMQSGIRSLTDNILTWHTARYTNDTDVKIYKKVIETWNKSEKRLRYDELPEELITHKNSKSFLDRFKVLASNLPYSHTMIAHIAKDGHYFIHPDIKQARSITVREAARIQAFPDNYFFEGSRTAAFTQIGNAVPPLMAKSFAEKLFSVLNNI